MTTVLEAQKKKWESLARENDRYYVHSADYEQSDEYYESSGATSVHEYIVQDEILAGYFPDLKKIELVEVGCGSGRMTRTLADLFKFVYAVDISPTMLAKAQAFVQAGNVRYVESDGRSISIPDCSADFAFSYIVYQHCPTREIVVDSFREISRVLRPGGIFKSQVRGARHLDPDHWSWGEHFSRRQAREAAVSAGLELLHVAGAKTRTMWLWLRKPD